MIITLKDGSKRQYQDGMSAREVLADISAGLARAAVAVQVNGQTLALGTVLQGDCELNALTFNDEEGREVYRHTASHIMAQAVQELYPGTKLAIGPAIENGFYYDFDSEHSFSQEDFAAIESKMKEIVKADYPLERFELPRAQAIALMAQKQEPYKVELIEDLPEDAVISFYRQGDFTDLCAGPHLDSTGRVKAFRLMSVAGAYWRGNENNKMLQRIYATAFEKKSDVDAYITQVEEAKMRDHRRIGRELDLFSIDDYVGPGLVLWHPKLSVVREEIELYWRREHRRRGYEYIYTPNIGKSNLWETSGHLQTFSDGMYPPMQMALKDAQEEANYYVKPMSCPFHVRVYKSRPHSYRELPVRYCELGTVYRYERSGALQGMLRVRGFTQDDAHIICAEDQFEDEINQVLDFAVDMNRVFGFDKLKVYLSVRDLKNKEAKYVGGDEIWQSAEQTLEKLLVARGVEVIKDVGGAKFYGPAIDLKAVDAMGREWQGTTIQLDMNLPTRFGMTYVGADGKEHTPIMIHRTLLGSMERFVATLIEQCAGAFPLWLAPVQVKVLTITERADEFAREIGGKFGDIRVQADLRNEKIGFKIREARNEKVPYIVVIGDKEVEQGTVAVRKRGSEQSETMPIDEFMRRVEAEIAQRVIF